MRGAYHLAKQAALFSAFDTATVCVLTLLGLALLFVSRWWAPLRWTAWVIWTALLYAVLLLAVVSVPVIEIYRWPLTLQLIEYSRVLSDPAGLRYITALAPAWVLGLAAAATTVPIVTGILSVRVSAGMHVARGTAILIIAVAGLSVGTYLLLATSKLADREDDYLFRSAAVEFALSTATPPIQALADYAKRRPMPDEEILRGTTLPRPASPPKNVIIFVIESLSARQVDGFNDPLGITPNLMRLSARSIRMSHAYAHAPSSSVSLSSIFDSSVPVSLEGGHPNPATSLIAVVKRHGLRTSYFLSGVSYKDDFQFLKDLKIDTVRDGTQIPCKTTRSRSLEGSAFPVDDKCALGALIDWIDAGDAPFLAVLWNNQTHYPYYVNRLHRHFELPNVPSQWYRDSLTLYLNAAQETDAVLGELVHQLDVRGLRNETLILVLGDHGEAFGQHGVGGHGTDVFEESIHIPLVMLFPGFSGPLRYDGLFGEVDIAPTIVSLMGFERPKRWQGIDVFSGERNRRLFYYANGQDALVGYREDYDKITLRMPQPALRDVVFRRDPSLRETFHRYDLRTDPAETHDIGVAKPLEKERVKRLLAHWLASQ